MHVLGVDIRKPSPLIQYQVRDLERKYDRLLKDLQADDKPAEDEVAKIRDLLRRVLNPWFSSYKPNHW